MATTIVTKSGSGAPTASDLVAGELAVDLTNGRLYTEDSGGTVLELGLNPSGNVDVTGSVTADGLTVETSTDPASITLRHTGNTSGFLIKNFSGGEAQLVNVDNGPMVFKTNDTERMRITSAGQTQVVGYDAMTLGFPAVAGGASRSGIKPTVTGAGAGQLQFLVGGDNTTEATTIAATLDASGNLGIGTSSPTSALQVGDGTDTVNWLRLTGTVSDLYIGQNLANNSFGQTNAAKILSVASYPLAMGTANAYPVIFGTADAERMRIDASGHAIIPAGVTLGTAVGTYNAANTLDDYEEGTWTPAFANMGTGTYTTQVGRYTKVGNLVTASVHIDINVLGTASGSLEITLPFTSSDMSYIYGSSSAIHAQNFTTAAEGLNVLIFPNTASAAVYSGAGATSGAVAVTHAVMGTGNFLCTFVYFTA